MSDLMVVAHLGPAGTYAEAAAMAYVGSRQDCTLQPYGTISQAIEAITRELAAIAVVPVENSLEGSVTMTLDTLWQLKGLYVQQELVMPIEHMLISTAGELTKIECVYSHPQALSQCQDWLKANLPHAERIPTNSTTASLAGLDKQPTAAAISSARAAALYELPILVRSINDRPENCTRFWVLGRTPAASGSRTSLAFTLSANVPGALLRPLEVFARSGINMTRIVSRPTKRSLGEYLFFVDLAVDAAQTDAIAAFAELATVVETIENFGTYAIVTLE
jgi:prephenate dehydratase